MQPGPAMYEERYRWTPAVAWPLVFCTACVVICIPNFISLVARVPITAFGAWGIFNCIMYPASRKVAFRVDHMGVTLGGSPLRYRATTRFFAWADIEKIVLWQRIMLFGSLRYIGLERRPGAPPLSGGGTGRADKPIHLSYSPPVTGIATGAARGLSAWRLDDDQLAAAITACAPTVQLVDAAPRTTDEQP